MQSLPRRTDPRTSAWPSRRAVVAWLLFVGYLFSLNAVAAVTYWRRLPDFKKLDEERIAKEEASKQKVKRDKGEKKRAETEKVEKERIERERGAREQFERNLSGSVAVIVLCTPELKTGGYGSAGLFAEIDAIQRKYAGHLVGGSVLLFGASSHLPVSWQSTRQFPGGMSAFRADEVEGAFEASFEAIVELLRRRTDHQAPFTTVLVWLSEANLDDLREQRVTVPDGLPVRLAWAGLESTRGSTRLQSSFGDGQGLLTLGQSPPSGVLANYVGHLLLSSTEDTQK
ncbi:MAG TPA: hypothetical protein VF278_06810 [Pirellulales bacterium]